MSVVEAPDGGKVGMMLERLQYGTVEQLRVGAFGELRYPEHFKASDMGPVFELDYTPCVFDDAVLGASQNETSWLAFPLLHRLKEEEGTAG